MIDKKLEVLFEDLTVPKVKRAYKKTGLKPRRGGHGCAIDAIAKARGLKEWIDLMVYDNGPGLRAFTDGFDGRPMSRESGYYEYYNQGQIVAKEVIGNAR